MTIQLTSPSFREGETIPKKYTCDSDDVSPTLAWNSIPIEARSLTLIMDDPDAPVGLWVHWILVDIPANLNGLPEGVCGIGIEGKNSWGRTGYGGPCPPKGKPHRYFFKLYALDTSLNLKIGVDKATVEKAMRGHILAQGQLIGLFGR